MQRFDFPKHTLGTPKLTEQTTDFELPIYVWKTLKMIFNFNVFHPVIFPDFLRIFIFPEVVSDGISIYLDRNMGNHTRFSKQNSLTEMHDAIL